MFATDDNTERRAIAQTHVILGVDEGKLCFKIEYPGRRGVHMSTKVVCWDDRESIKYLLSNLPSSQTLTVFTRYIPTLTIWGFHHTHDSPSPISLSTAITAILFSQWWRPFQFEGWLCYDKNYRMIFYPIINLLPSCSSFSAPCDFYL